MTCRHLENPLQVAVEKVMSRDIGLGVKESCRGTRNDKRGMLSTVMKEKEACPRNEEKQKQSNRAKQEE